VSRFLSVGAPADESTGVLPAQARAWEERPLIRRLYQDWYGRIAAELSRADGPTVELGCGIGSFKRFMPSVVATDVEESPWADQVVDAGELPFGDGSVANVVMTDVLHHLPEPVACLEEVERVLAPGGRFVALEPFCSPVSKALYRRFHVENLEEGVDPFSGSPQAGEDPWDANIALPTLLFWRDRARLRVRVPRLEPVRLERLSWLVYPLSGGFSGPRLVPMALVPALRRIEDLLPLERLAAFRCLVTLEKR
jgi:SAM-dependent methyltransferase